MPKYGEIQTIQTHCRMVQSNRIKAEGKERSMEQPQTATARKSFYVQTKIFEQGYSRIGKLVLLYLCRTANREGKCYPSIATIAEQCGCCENSVRKAIRELCGAGAITSEPCFITTQRGRVRQRSNLYTLTQPPQKEPPYAPACDDTPPAESAPTPLQPVNPPPAKSEGEINHNSNLTTAHTDPSFPPREDGKEIDAIVDGLHLQLYTDRAFAKTVEHVIRRMYDADGITVKKQRIPQGAVRNVLRMLRIEHIDYVQLQLARGAEPVVCGEGYLMSCLYNAPTDCAVIGLRERNLL